MNINRRVISSIKILLTVPSSVSGSSITKKGISRIVPSLKPGAGVVTTRAHVHYIITEYGIASLYGKTIKDRVKALVNIAHPSHRESIERAYFELI